MLQRDGTRPAAILAPQKAVVGVVRVDMEIRRRTHETVADFAGHLHPVLRRVYAARGIASDSELDLSLERLLPVGSLEGLDAATQLLGLHRAAGRVLVIGDFDADGATSTALLVRALRALRFAHVDFLVPNRFRFGYGLTPEIVALAATRAPTLIVTVDNGVSSVAGVEAAHAIGVPVLVTDHHLPGTVLPRAAVIVNPNLPGSRFASPALAGVGVAFYLVAALARALGEASFRAADYLDLVALGTVADMVPLDRNNRILVSHGIKRIRAGRCVAGIRALLESAGRNRELLSAADLGFAVAPRLNAAGRLTDMSVGIACLLTDDYSEAQRLAAMLTQLNVERREIEQRMQLEAVGLAADLREGEAAEALGICLFDETWHQGVVGLVAGRIKDRLHRPVIAFARGEDGSLRGSARSIPGINIRDALDSVAAQRPELIDRFGGHAMAAGLSLRESNLPAFRLAFAAEIARRANRELLSGAIYSDGPLSAAELCIGTAEALRGAGPWGQGFPEPAFDGQFIVEESRIVGDKHMKMRLRLPDPGTESIDAIAFGYLGSPSENADLRGGATIQLVYRLEINEYRGVARVQLNCQHVGVERSVC
jgi:single-stranded-DNA-specific exonuclease